MKRCKECGRLIVRISWSSMRTHEECKQKGYLSRKGHGASLDNKRNFLPGTITDLVVRDWLNFEDGPENHLGEMPDMVHDRIMEGWRKILAKRDGTPEDGVVRWRHAGDRDTVEAECIEAVTKIEPDLMEKVVPFEYQADFRFDSPLQVPHPAGGTEEVILVGYMDILVRGPRGNFAVYDVKHTKDESYWRKTVGQLGFYDLAIELGFGQPTMITGLLQPLCKETFKPYRPSDESRVQLLSSIAAMADDIWRNNREPKVDMANCNYCRVKHACSKFTPVRDAKGRKRVSL